MIRGIITQKLLCSYYVHIWVCSYIHVCHFSIVVVPQYQVRAHALRIKPTFSILKTLIYYN